MSRRRYRRWSAADDAIVRAWATGVLTLQQAVAARRLTNGQIRGRAPRLALRVVPVLCATPSPPSRLCTADPHACQWPTGDPGTAGFNFCGAPRRRDGRSPYCAIHTRRAHWPVHDPHLRFVGMRLVRRRAG
jgi:GcrA cell cycle regulator